MAAKTTRHTLSLNLVGNIKSKLEGISEAARGLEDDMNRGIGTAAKYAAAWEVAKLAVEKAAQTIREGVDAFVSMEAAQGRLQDSFKRTNAEFGQFQKAQTLARIAAKKYGIQMEASLDSIRRLTDATGDSKTALNDYSLAINIAQKEGKDLAEITELLSNARKGEVGELKKLAGVNQDLVTQLGKIEGAATRGMEAVNLLTDEYSGAAEATRGTADALAASEERMRVLKSSVGELAISLGRLVGVVSYDDQLTWFDKFAYGMKEFSEQTSEVVTEVGKLYDAFETLSVNEIMAMLIDGRSPFEIMDTATNRAAKQKAAGTSSVELDSDIQQELLRRLDEIKAGGSDPRVRELFMREAVASAQAKQAKRTGFSVTGVSTLPDVDAPQYTSLKQQANAGKPKAAKAKKSGRGGGGTRLSDVPEAGQAAGYKDVAEARVGTSNSMAAAVMDIETNIADHHQDQADRQVKASAEAAKKILDEEEKLAEARKAFEESKNEAAMIGLQASVDVASQLGANESVIAGIRAAMEIGEGLAALAPNPAAGFPFGNPAGAAAHFAAAAQFGVAAAMAGGGGGTPGKKGGGGVPRATMQANTERQNQNEERQPTVVENHYDFSRSVGVGPRAAREFAVELDRGRSFNSGSARVF